MKAKELPDRRVFEIAGTRIEITSAIEQLRGAGFVAYPAPRDSEWFTVVPVEEMASNEAVNRLVEMWAYGGPCPRPTAWRRLIDDDDDDDMPAP